MVGTTRSRVSFFLNKFGKLGFIDDNGGLHVRSSRSYRSRDLLTHGIATPKTLSRLENTKGDEG